MTNKPTQETLPSWLRSLTQQGADHASPPTGIRTHGVKFKGFALFTTEAVRERGEMRVGSERKSVCAVDRTGAARVESEHTVKLDCDLR